MNRVKLSHPTRPGQKPIVLAVDDEDINRMILTDLLQQHFELLTLDSGQACLNALQHITPDLILLDVSMPQMSGFDVCRWLKSHPRFYEIPVIFLTAKITDQDQTLGLALGAVDYITKPFSEAILLARMQTHLRLSDATQQVKKAHAQLQHEREIIERIMQAMHQDQRFVAHALRSLILPVAHTSGDVLLSAQTPDGRRQVLLGDFTGHGLASAIAGPLVSALFYAQAANNIDLAQTAQRLNQELCLRLPTELFMAAILLEWRLDSPFVTIWNCAMPALQVFRHGKWLAQIPSQSPAMGIVEPFYSNVQPTILKVHTGDVLLGFTDGFLEARSPQGHPFGQSALLESLDDLLSLGLPLSYLQTQLLAFVGAAGVQDDATVLEIRV